VNVGFAGYDDWQDRYVPRSKPLTDVSVGEVLEQALSIEPAKWTRADQMRVSSFLKARKWERYKSSTSGREAREWRYRAPGSEGGS
jgi:hypothetical protein